MNFAHFRNLRGTGQRFTEQFHDDGDVDMAAIMRAFLDAGYTGAMRPDHVPLMEGDGSDDPGYTMTGRLTIPAPRRGPPAASHGQRFAAPTAVGRSTPLREPCPLCAFCPFGACTCSISAPSERYTASTSG